MRSRIGIAGSEGSEVGFSVLDNPLGSNFLSFLLSSQTLGDFMKGSRDIKRNVYSSPTVVLPVSKSKGRPGYLRVSGLAEAPPDENVG